MRPVLFTRVPRAEMIHAQDWYENESPGLGRRFLAAVGTILERMMAIPGIPVVYRTVRRALLRRFPYALLFVIESDEALTVVACFHSSRDPMHWQQHM